MAKEEDEDGGGGGVMLSQGATLLINNESCWKAAKVVYTQNYLDLKVALKYSIPRAQKVLIHHHSLTNHYLFGKLSESDMSEVADAMEVYERTADADSLAVF